MYYWINHINPINPTLPINPTINMINKTMNITEIIKKNPKAQDILLKFGLGCANCGLGAVETLEEGAKAHGLSVKEVNELLNKLSEI